MLVFRILQESGMVVVSTEEGSLLQKSDTLTNGPVLSTGSVLLSQDVANMLEKSGDGSLGTIVKSTPRASTGDCGVTDMEIQDDKIDGSLDAFHDEKADSDDEFYDAITNH